MIKGLYKYKLPLLLGSIIVTIMLISPFFLFHIDQIKDIYPSIMAVGGLLFAVPIRLFWDLFMRPDLEVSNEPEFIGVTHRNLDHNNSSDPNFVAVRAIIKNKGRTSALNCKGYLIYKDPRFYREIKERVCWIIGSNREAVNINSQDEERLDIFIVPIEGLTGDSYIYYPFESGKYNSNRAIFKDYLNSLHFLVTSENAVPINVSIDIDINYSSFEQLITLGEKYVEHFKKNPLPIKFNKKLY